MLQVGFLGGGGHSRGNHLPALRQFQAAHPGAVAMTAFCDIDSVVAERIGREYQFASTYTNLDAMLAAHMFDAFIAITPVNATAGIASKIMRAGIPLLMEKPPGATVAETVELCELAQKLDSRVMVSLNRRFDPAIVAAGAWRGDRPMSHLLARVLRHDRREIDFMTDTGIHCIDTVRSLGGEIADYKVRCTRNRDTWWYLLDITFRSGATGSIEISPACGCQMENYELMGSGYRVVASVAEFDLGTVMAWENGSLVRDENPTDGSPMFIRNGTYAETMSFFSAIIENRAMYPTLEEVLPSVQICHEVRRSAN